jgi:hypothetical protein
MSGTPGTIDEILARLAKDVESAVHAMYRRQVGPGTARVRTEQFVAEARSRLAAAGAQPDVALRSGSGPMQRFSAVTAADATPAASAEAWTSAEAAAVVKCVMGWLPAGSPSSAKPDSRCVPAGRELVPAWGERELARAAIRKVPVAT